MVDAAREWSRFGKVEFVLIGGVHGPDGSPDGGPDPRDLVALQRQESGGEEWRAEECEGMERGVEREGIVVSTFRWRGALASPALVLEMRFPRPRVMRV